MDARVSVDQVRELPSEIDQLVSASDREGFRFLGRLRAEWDSGANRFDNPGEALFVAYVGSRVAGVCGLNRDPYSSDSRVGRLRRLYVLPEFRRQGVARCLVSSALAVAREYYASVRVRTDNPVAATFYEALGFARAPSSDDASHEIVRGRVLAAGSRLQRWRSALFVAAEARCIRQGKATMIALYHAPFSRSVRVLWLLEELGTAYELKTLPPIATTSPFSQATPTGKVPTIEDDGLVMFESIAIMEYILERYGAGRLAPSRGSREWGVFLQWLHYSESTAFPPLGYIARHSFALPAADRIAASAQENRALAAKVLAVPEQALERSDYLLGQEFSAADIAMGYTIGTAKLLGLLEDSPNLTAYFARLSARPAFQRATQSAS